MYECIKGMTAAMLIEKSLGNIWTINTYNGGKNIPKSYIGLLSELTNVCKMCANTSADILFVIRRQFSSRVILFVNSSPAEVSFL